MRLTATLLAFLCLLVSCEKEAGNTSTYLPDGRYVGGFHRTGMDTAGITLDIDHNRFNGSSDIRDYPVICAGRYEITDGTITFTDTCSWTADFDWSLVTDGNYLIDAADEQNIRIWKTNDGVTDEYRLRRLVR